jgi:hypothetical protein
MIVFRSKVGLELVIPITILLGGIAFLFIVQKIWPGVAIVASVGVFVFYTFVTTRYTVQGNTVRIQCGLFFDETIDINSITAINETRNAISSPAASLDRMEIRLTTNTTILISPANTIGFLNTLQKINPGIVITVKGFK